MIPEISIIIPCYNRIELLKLTLKNVELAIKGINSAIILVDDGSEIPIKSNLYEFNHLPIIIIRQQNLGLTTALYNGLFAAKGEYIQFLDSDDQISSQKFVKQLKAMREQNADVSHTVVLKASVDRFDKIIPISITNIEHDINPAKFLYIYTNCTT